MFCSAPDPCCRCPRLAFTNSAVVAIVGVLIWGAVLESKIPAVKALVADLVPPNRRATAYGVFAAVQGAAAIAGGTLAGALMILPYIICRHHQLKYVVTPCKSLERLVAAAMVVERGRVVLDGADAGDRLLCLGI